jgi:transcription elongation factor Elf1
MDLVDSKYIGLVSSRLQKFKRVKADLYNFRCPLCGDSKKQKNKARGYFYQVKTNTNFKCHNCGASLSFNNFLKQIDSTLHKQYTFEKFKEGHTGKNFVVEEPKFNFKKPSFAPKIDLPKASENDAAKKYLENRKLNPDKFYYTDKFKEWTNSHKQTFDSVKYDEPRIIIPLIYQNNMVGFQGRSLGPNKVKYITVMLNDDSPKIYGLDTIRRDAPTFITEGPFDSTFIRNSIAMCGADADVSRWGINDPIWIYDNEPRSPEIVRRIKSVISSEQTNKVVIWPSNINEKDINEMVLSGHDVQSLVELNTYSGLQAKLQFNIWKKI